MAFKHILFPVDFSDRSYGAAPYVRAMAERSGGAVTLLNVVETPPAWLGAGDAAYVADFDLPGMIDEARRRLSIFAANNFGCDDVAVLVESGEPGACIGEVARVGDADL